MVVHTRRAKPDRRRHVESEIDLLPDKRATEGSAVVGVILSKCRALFGDTMDEKKAENTATSLAGTKNRESVAQIVSKRLADFAGEGQDEEELKEEMRGMDPGSVEEMLGLKREMEMAAEQIPEETQERDIVRLGETLAKAKRMARQIEKYVGEIAVCKESQTAIQEELARVEARRKL